jgi:HTH-type transcriptional repressor of NAD biosynthesis genes
VDLPYTSVSSREASKVWSDYIMKILPDVNIIFTSEKYGEYCAEYMNIEHMYFDTKREKIPISSSQIKSNVIKNFDYIVDCSKPYFVKKICVCGSESTGKTTLCKYLANYFKTNYVDECARDIVSNTYECTEETLQQIILARANDMKEKIKHSNRLIFSDTDLYTTLSYSKYLFNKDLIVPEWIVELNKFDLYLFLEHDAPYIQDGTRVSYEDRILLGQHHLKYFKESGLNIEIVDGIDWEERTKKAIKIIETFKNYKDK